MKFYVCANRFRYPFIITNCFIRQFVDFEIRVLPQGNPRVVKFYCARLWK